MVYPGKFLILCNDVSLLDREFALETYGLGVGARWLLAGLASSAARDCCSAPFVGFVVTVAGIPFYFYVNDNERF